MVAWKVAVAEAVAETVAVFVDFAEFVASSPTLAEVRRYFY